MRAPVRPIRGRWPRPLEARLGRAFRVDPLTILDDDADPSTFREAMSSTYVGDTIKITGSGRHAGADDLLIGALDLRQAAIVDVGASDGSTSVDLVERLGEFRSFTIADLYLTLRAVDVLGHTAFFDGQGRCTLVAGRRLAAWPGLSRPVALLYSPLISAARRRQARAREVLLLNPSARRLIASDPRVGYAVHDVFTPWTGQRPDVIKVANLLRRLYFSDQDLLRALRALHSSLPEGGHLLLVDNPRRKNTPPGVGLYRREGDHFTEVARSGHPEIADLVTLVGTGEPSLT